jgi:hypothetical protein
MAAAVIPESDKFEREGVGTITYDVVAYGHEKYSRLARIKRAFDSDNVLHLNVNIKPLE